MAQKKMVGWYNPLQLGKTAVEVAVSVTLGTRADYRVVEALASSQEVIRLRSVRGNLA